jgi:hypothetical protein
MGLRPSCGEGCAGQEARRGRGIPDLRPSGVIVESVPDRTLRIVPEPTFGFWDASDFVDGISGRLFA